MRLDSCAEGVQGLKLMNREHRSVRVLFGELSEYNRIDIADLELSGLYCSSLKGKKFPEGPKIKRESGLELNVVEDNCPNFI